MAETQLLDSIHSPDDVKRLSEKECTVLAQEIRSRIVEVVSHNGGHLASNLGVVELTLALHRVFSTPEDILIWDVGHQCYTHKILTGRNDRFASLRQKGGISGFPKRQESVHDAMDTGHASTSVSAALGMLEARRLQGKGGKAVAVIGDGALTGGMAFEALNHAGHLKKDLIVVLNDNDMSISRNVGALSSKQRRGRVSALISRWVIRPFYQHTKDALDRCYAKFPKGLKWAADIRFRIKKGIKAFVLKESLFSELGFAYVGPINGHNMPLMERVFNRVKQLKVPVVVHVMTHKGKGYSFAEADPASFHGVGCFNVVDGKVDTKSDFSFTECFSKLMLERAKTDSRLVAVSAAMINGTGLSAFQKWYPERTFDVGIAEQHAVTFAAGLAAQGAHPVVAVYSTFMQRAVDQVIHDVAIPSLPVVFVMSRAGFVPDDGETHQGLYDMALFRSVPNVILLAPSGSADFALIFQFAFEQQAPVFIRLPKSLCSFSPLLQAPVEIGRGIFVHCKHHPILLISLGGTYDEVEAALNLLARDSVLADHYNLRFAKPLNEAALMSDFAPYREILFFEDGCTEGGVGEKLAEFFSASQTARFYHWGAPDRFLPQAGRKELFETAKMDAGSIVRQVKAIVGR